MCSGIRRAPGGRDTSPFSGRSLSSCSHPSFPRFPSAIFPALCARSLERIATRLQARRFAAHLAAGGLRQSSWRVAGITVVSTVVLLACVIGFFLLTAPPESP